MANDKIREDEILSDDELDNVAGGHWAQTADDIVRAGKLGLIDINPGDTYAVADFYHTNLGELTNVFAKFGIEFTHRVYEENSYVHNGQQISTYEAWSIIRQKLGK